MKNLISSNMVLNGLELDVCLGWLEEERNTTQQILLDIFICFNEPPKACVTDDLVDTICYADLINKIQNNIAARKFRLLEHVGAEIYRFIKTTIGEQTPIAIRATKKPFGLELRNGVSFCYGDFKI